MAQNSYRAIVMSTTAST